MNKVYSPWGLEELDTTEQLTPSTSRLLAREVGDGLSMGVPMSPGAPALGHGVPVRARPFTQWVLVPLQLTQCACQSLALCSVGSGAPAVDTVYLSEPGPLLSGLWCPCSWHGVPVRALPFTQWALL